jgi:hypothetical protein
MRPIFQLVHQDIIDNLPYVLNIGLNNSPRTPEEIIADYFYGEHLIFAYVTMGKYVDVPEPTLVVGVVLENLIKSKDVESFLSGLCTKLNQECIAYETFKNNGLVYSPQFSGEKMEFNSNFFIKPKFRYPLVNAYNTDHHDITSRLNHSNTIYVESELNKECYVFKTLKTHVDINTYARTITIHPIDEDMIDYYASLIKSQSSYVSAISVEGGGLYIHFKDISHLHNFLQVVYKTLP